MGVNPPDGRPKADDSGDGRARPAASRPGDDSSHAGARWFDPAPDRRGSAAEPGWAGAEAAGPPSTALAIPALAAISGALARHRRFILAALAWPPIGFVVMALVGEATGCARFSASCADPTGPANTILQIAIQVLIVSAFLAAPAIARPAAAGTLAMLLAAAPASVVLVSFGGARAQGESQGLLIGLLAIAYGIGLAAAVGWPDRLPEPFGRRTMGG